VIGLIHKADAYRPTTTTGDYNESKLTYPDIPSFKGVKCRFSTLSTADRERLQAIGGSVSRVGSVRVIFDASSGHYAPEVLDRLERGSDTWEIVEVIDIDQREIEIEAIAVKAEGIIG